DSVLPFRATLLASAATTTTILCPTPVNVSCSLRPPRTTLSLKFGTCALSNPILHPRSSDGVNFKAYRVILEKSSSVLAEKLLALGSEPTHTSVTPEGTLPVLNLPEGAFTLRILLSAILPVRIYPPSSFEHAVPVLVAAKKYKAEAALSTLWAYIEKDIDLMVRPNNAFRAFCLARSQGLLREALAPARIALDLPMTIEGLDSTLRYAIGTSLYDMMSFRKCVRDRMIRSLDELRKSGELPSLWSNGCVGALRSDGTPSWIDEALTVMADPRSAFSNFDQSRFYSALHHHTQSTGCKSCADVPAVKKAIFWNTISLDIRMAITRAKEDFLSQRKSSSEQSLEFPTPTGGPVQFGPYDDLGAVDVIIRSSDGQDFPVHKLILSASSSFFRDMFSLPDVRPPAKRKRTAAAPTVHTIPVEEHSRVLGALLTLLYPRSCPKVDSYDLALHLLAAAQKYEMDGIMAHVRSIMSSQREAMLPLLYGHALFRQYAFAARHRLGPEAKSLAMLTFDRRLSFEEIGDSIRYLEGHVLYALLQYRRRCRDIVAYRLKSYLDLASPTALKFLKDSKQSFAIEITESPSRGIGVEAVEVYGCNARAVAGSIQPLWWRNFLSKLRTDVLSDALGPSIQALRIRAHFDSSLSAHLEDEPLCLMCAIIYASRKEQFCAALETELQEAIQNVPFELPRLE
ncbi:hypothetical protein BC834DRAFT_271472, partial [Gloeopeniophorella convolvens]